MLWWHEVLFFLQKKIPLYNTKLNEHMEVIAFLLGLYRLVTGCRGCYLVCRGRGSRLRCPDRIARAIWYRLMIYGTRLSNLRSEECTEIGLVNRNMDI